MAIITWLFSEILGATILIVAALYIYFKYSVFSFWRKRGIFYIEPSFPTGNVGTLVNAKHSVGEFFKDIYDKYKDHRLVGIYMSFKPNLIVNDPELIRIVLAKEFASFHDRGMFCNEKIDPLSGHLFLLPGKKWRNLRVRLTPTFTSGKIKQMFQTLTETGDALAKYLNGKAQARTTINIKDILARYATDIIMSTAFGITCNSLEDPNNDFRYYGKKVFEPKPFWNTLLMFIPQFFDFFSVPYTEKEITQFFTKVVKDSVEYRENNNITRKDFLDLLIQLKNKGFVDSDETMTEENTTGPTENKLTILEVAAQSYVFYLAGFETSSTTATFCLYELAVNQDIQDKVRKEIHTVIRKHGGITYNGVNEMTYLNKVVSETLRKYPPVPILNRICTKEIRVPTTDTLIPEGTLITIPVFGLHRDENIYPEPEKFDPERFNEENIASRHPYVYLPFGEGPRICIGLRFGLIQTKVGLINALMKNKFKLAPNMMRPIEYEEGSLVLSVKGGVDLIIEPA